MPILAWSPVALSPLAFPLGMLVAAWSIARKRDNKNMRQWAERMLVVLLLVALAALACMFGLYFLLPRATGGS